MSETAETIRLKRIESAAREVVTLDAQWTTDAAMVDALGRLADTLAAPPAAPEATDELTALRTECNRLRSLLRAVADDFTKLANTFEGTAYGDRLRITSVALLKRLDATAALSTDTKERG